MTPGARLAAAAEILDALDLAHPVEPQLRGWARRNRYAGAKDRRAIADRVYACLRRRRSLAARMDDGAGRALVLASLIDCDGLAPDEIAALCSGGYALAPPADRERRGLQETPRYADDGERLDCPEWLLAEAQASLGDSFAAEFESLRHRAPLDLRVNRLKADRDAAIAGLAEDGIAAEPVPGLALALRLESGARIANARAFLDGLVEPQDAGSQAAAMLARVQPSETVLDFCAGAGGKTLALGAEMNKEGEIIAFDIAPNRMDPLAERAARAGLGNLRIARTMQELEPLKGRCDCVFVDAPCSGSGTWRRDPAGKWALTPERLDTLHRAQAEALDRAVDYVRAGGRLVYTTCSLLESENGTQVTDFLDRHVSFAAGAILTLRPARDGCDGFFAAVLTRIG